VLQEVIKTSRYVVCRSAATTLATTCAHHTGRRGISRPVLPDALPVSRHPPDDREKYSDLARSCLFSIQTQSLYDASIDGLPHFLYTDHTHLANLKYPGANGRSCRSPVDRTRKDHLPSRGGEPGDERLCADSLVEDYDCDPARIAIIGAAPNVAPPDDLPDNGGIFESENPFCGDSTGSEKGVRSC